MQIHELTRKPLREASIGGAVSGAASIAGGIGTQLVNKLAKAQGLNPVIGGQNQATGAGAQGAAAAANDPLIKGLATAAAKEFKQDVYELMKTMRDPSGIQATSATEIPDAKLRGVLYNMVTRLIGEPLNNLVAKADPKAHDGQGKAYAAELADTIKDQISAIIVQEKSGKPDPTKESALWNTLAQAITGAKSELAFSQKGFGSTPAKSGATPGATPQPLSGAQMRMADEMGLNTTQIAAIQAQVAKVGGGAMTPDLKALFGVTK